MGAPFAVGVGSMGLQPVSSSDWGAHHLAGLAGQCTHATPASRPAWQRRLPGAGAQVSPAAAHSGWPVLWLLVSEGKVSFGPAQASAVALADPGRWGFFAAGVVMALSFAWASLSTPLNDVEGLAA